MRRFFLLLIASSFSAFCQFYNLTTTNDGSQLYFSSSFQLRGSTGENTHEKIFVHDASGFRLVGQGQGQFYHLTTPLVSGNGAVTGYIGLSDSGPWQTTINFSGALFPSVLPYQCQISGNARYGLCESPSNPSTFVIDLFSGTTSAPTSDQCFGPQQIASNGTAIAGQFSGGIILFGMGFSRPAASDFFLPAGCPIISDNASVASWVNFGRKLIAYSVATGTEKEVLSPPTQDITGLGITSISSDGSLILAWMLDSSGVPQLLVVHSNGSESIRLTDDPLGFQNAVISGDGSTVYAVGGDGRLVQIDVASKKITTLIGSTPLVTGTDFIPVPGSYTEVSGLGLSSSTEAASSFPAPNKIGDVQVTIDGTPMPLLSISPTAIQLQIPWETPVGTATIEVIRPTTPFVQPPTSISVLSIQPVGLTQPISQDFSQFIGPQKGADNVVAANPGDIVSYYVTGLGAVNAIVADGALAPVNPLALVTTPLRVTGDYPVAGENLQITYAGLAPGTVGIYLLSIKMPDRVPQSNPNAPPQFERIIPTLWYSATQSIQLPPIFITTN